MSPNTRPSPHPIWLAALLAAAPACAAPTSHPIAPTAANWRADGNIEFPPDALAAAPDATLRINSGAVERRGPPFADGTIEYDELDLPAPGGMDFPSIRVRAHGTESAEQVYLRPEPDCPHSDDCIQYAPILHTCLLWDAYPQYQSGGPVHETGWNHVRLVVAGRLLRAYVNNAITPTLAVDELEGDPSAGTIQLNGPALYRNIVVTPGLPTALPPSAPQSTLDPKIVRHWRLSPPSPVPPGPPPTYADRPTSTAGWTPITAETAGFINIGRRDAPPPRGAGEIAWLATAITSDRPRTVQVSLGWARSIALFVNGHPAFTADNFYFGLDSTRRTPDARLSLENGTFVLRLHAGRNDILAAVNDFFPGSAVHAGWGLILQLHDLDGITLDG